MGLTLYLNSLVKRDPVSVSFCSPSGPVTLHFLPYLSCPSLFCSCSECVLHKKKSDGKWSALREERLVFLLRSYTYSFRSSCCMGMLLAAATEFHALSDSVTAVKMMPFPVARKFRSRCIFACISAGLSLKIVGQRSLKCMCNLLPWTSPFPVSRVSDAAVVHAHVLARLGMPLAQGLVSESQQWFKIHKICNFSTR